MILSAEKNEFPVGEGEFSIGVNAGIYLFINRVCYRHSGRAPAGVVFATHFIHPPKSINTSPFPFPLPTHREIEHTW